MGKVRLIERNGHGSLMIQTLFKFDHLGRKVQMTDPDHGIFNYQYNALGELTWQKDNKNQIVCQSYDGVGRITERTRRFAGGTNCGSGTLDQSLSYQYDSKTHGNGLLAKTTDHVNNIIVENRYNRLSQTVEEKTLLGGRDYYRHTVYDSANNYRVKTSYDASRGDSGVDYRYSDHYLVEKTDQTSGTSLWLFNKANALGNVTGFEYGNGIKTVNAYDPYDGTLASNSVTSGVAFFQSHSYQFDSTGNLSFREDQLKNSKESYTYDEVNRLDGTSLSIGGATVLTDVDYDHLGNITKKTGVGSYHYDGSSPHAVSSISAGAMAGSFAYDGNGNMTSGGGRSLIHYDTNNKPTLIQTANMQVEFNYGMGGTHFKRKDTLSNCTAQQVCVTEILYVGHVEFVTKDNELKEIQRQIEGIAIETEYVTTGIRELQFLHQDHLGSVNMITNEAGKLVQAFSYDPWGQRSEAYSSGTNFMLGQAAQLALPHYRRGYTGHEHLDGVGLIHMNGRVYDPRLGRFLSADPVIQQPDNLQNLNRYSYVLNNPLNATDPTGYVYAQIIAAALTANQMYATAYAIIEIALKIYQIYSVISSAYGTIQAFKYHQNLSGAMSAFSTIKGAVSLASDNSSDGLDGTKEDANFESQDNQDLNSGSVTTIALRSGKTPQGTDVSKITDAEKAFVATLEREIVDEYFSLVEQYNQAINSGNAQLADDLNHAIEAMKIATWSYTNDFATDGAEAKTTTTFMKDTTGQIVAEKVHIAFYKGAINAYNNGSPANTGSGYHVNLKSGDHAIRGLIVHELAHAIPRVNIETVNGRMQQVKSRHMERKADDFLKSTYPKQY